MIGSTFQLETLGLDQIADGEAKQCNYAEESISWVQGAHDNFTLRLQI